MIHIEKIKIKNNDSFPGSHVLKKGQEFVCKDVNILVGEQGCGKSTLLQMLFNNHSDIEFKFNDINNINKINSYYFDSEKDNPRTKNPELYTKPNGENTGIGYGNALRSRFKSHGEIMEQFVIHPLTKAKNAVIILDEPESSLSLTNQYKLINNIKIAVKNNCQFFIASHCYLLINAFDVISLEHNKQMTGTEFINIIKTEQK